MFSGGLVTRASGALRQSRGHYAPYVASCIAHTTGAQLPSPPPPPPPLGFCNSVGQRRQLMTEDGYLHKTRIPMDHFQDSLPKLPLPTLEETLERYLDSVVPLATTAELEHTRALAANFAAGEGADLHAELSARNDASYTSYIAAPWSEMYLRDRQPLPLNVSPQLTLCDDPDPRKNGQAERASQLISASVAFYRTLRDGYLTPDIFHRKPEWSKTERYEQVLSATPRRVAWPVSFLFQAYPLDMSQYANLFHSTRVPDWGRDRLVSTPDTRHIVVQRGADIFCVNVLEADGTAVAPESIFAQMRAILAQPLRPSSSAGGDISGVSSAAASSAASSPSPSVLTAGHRDDWARWRGRLREEPVNRDSLDRVESALFAVCLEDNTDGPSPNTPVHAVTEAEAVAQNRVMLHGDARNRWFDKSFQIIITPNGKAAINFEHSWGDGMAVLRYAEEIFACARDEPLPTSAGLPATTSTAAAGAAAASVPVPAPLPWKLDAAARTEIARVGAAFDAHSAAVDQRVLTTPNAGRQVLREVGLPADPAMQMAFQLGHFRMRGHNASTYESAATVGFKHGRTETVRSCTRESDAFCRAFTTPNTTRAAREEAMRKACARHAELAKAGVMGKGWDRHMFALAALAAPNVPPLFADPVYARMGRIILSTSTLNSSCLDGGGFGPVNEDCFAVGYGVNDDGARISVMSHGIGSDDLVEAIEGALHDMVAVAGGKDCT